MNSGWGSQESNNMTVTSQKKKPTNSMEGGEMSGGSLSRRKADKDKRAGIHANGLFDAVEQQDLDKVKVILETSSLDINSVNIQGMTVLDIAVMTNNIPIAKMLLAHGAKESPLFEKGECRVKRLESLVQECERRVVDLTASVLNGSAGNANVSPAHLKEKERQLSHWEFKHRLVKRMKAGFDHARPPDAPSKVTLHVSSDTSLMVSFEEPQRHNGAVVTRYKVEWSGSPEFVPIAGEITLEQLSRLQVEIKKLTKGKNYFVRVAAGNVKGYGPWAETSPTSAAPSSWKEVDEVTSRLDGKLATLHSLFHRVQRSRPPEVSDMKEMFQRGKDSPSQQKKRVSLKNLFVSTPKFQKNIKRGVHMACLLYNEDRVLVTSDDLLPIVEVDETFSGLTIHNDLYWLLKISCMWDDVKTLKNDMDKSSSASTMLRCKLLQAITSLQSALGIQDLGQFFHRPIRDSQGSMVFVVVNHIVDPKAVTLGSAKWVTLGKLARRQSLSALDMGDAHSLLVNSMPEMIVYHQVVSKTLTDGLYLAYLKLHTSLDVLRVMVPSKLPTSLPCVKVRDCQNVSREEWEWLRDCDRISSTESPTQSTDSTPSQHQFQSQLADASRKLFKQLDLDESNLCNHRLYHHEVVELSPRVSLLLVLPSIEDICIVPGGHSDTLTSQGEYCFLPVQVFESTHMNAYAPEMFTLYSQLSTVVDIDAALAQQHQRQAFSSEETQRAKEQVEQMAQLQATLDKLWKCARWVRHVTSFARNKDSKAGIHLSHVISTSPAHSMSSNQSQCNNNNNHNNTNDTPIIMAHTNIHPVDGSAINQSHLQNKLAKAVGRPNLSGLPNTKTINIVKERRIAKFFDPNEENPHSKDSISVGVQQQTTPSPTETPSNPLATPLSSQTTPTDFLTLPHSTSKSVPSSPGAAPAGTTRKPHHVRLSSSSSLSSLSTAGSSSSSSSSNTSDPNWGIIKVHAMYETGLSKHVNMKLHITEHTTCRDVINLVVRHLNTLATQGGLHVYPETQLSQFCVVLQYQGHRSVLGDQFKLLQLRGPLKKARVCVTLVGSDMTISTTSSATSPSASSRHKQEVEEDILLHGRATLV